MNRKNQKEEVLAHIQTNGYITSWEAIKKYKITRISAKIFTLRNEGFDIKTRMYINRKTKSKFGVYYLKDKEIIKYEKQHKGELV